MALTVAAIKAAKPKDKGYKLSDAGGLYLMVSTTGAKSWRVKYRIDGKEKTYTIGQYPDYSLQEARQERDKAKSQIRKGVDPSAKRNEAKRQRRIQVENLFGVSAYRWHELNTPRWTPRYALKVRQMIDRRLMPYLGDKPIHNITSADVLAVLRLMEDEGIGETTRKVKNYLQGIFAYAIAEGLIENNPVPGITPALKAVPPANHQRALPFSMMGNFLTSIDAYGGHPVVKLGLKLLILTMTRTGEVRFGRWSEIDFEKRLWLIPAERMKMKTDHLIPLSHQAIDVLTELRQHTGHTEWLLRSPNAISKPLSENAFLVLLKRTGFKQHTTTHGLRSTASTVLNEAGFRPDVIEKQLAHEERNQIRKAYNRADYLEERAEMLQWWADRLDEKQTGSNVIPGKFIRQT